MQFGRFNSVIAGVLCVLMLTGLAYLDVEAGAHNGEGQSHATAARMLASTGLGHGEINHENNREINRKINRKINRGDGMEWAEPVEQRPRYDEHLLIVKFGPDYRVRLRGGSFVDLDGRADPAELAYLDDLGEWTRAFSVDEAFIDAKRKEAEAIKGEALPDLNNYFHFQLPAEWTPAKALGKLNQSPLLRYVDRIPIPLDPPSPNNDLYIPVPSFTDPPGPGAGTSIYQRYLDPAPDGVDARWAWDGAGGRGEGVRVCDIERNFNSSHFDLPPITTLGPEFSTEFIDHGTMTMGVLGALENGKGITGIVPQAEFYFAYVGWNLTPSQQQAQQAGVHDAIFRCLNALNYGDIILIEQQVAGPEYSSSPDSEQENPAFGAVPVDWNKPVYDAILIASQTTVVVAAAGNGEQWLDLPMYVLLSDHAPFVPANSSGALHVGAGYSPYSVQEENVAEGLEEILARQPRPSSNRGSTVRIQGWGNGIVTTGGGTLHLGPDENGQIDITYGNENYGFYGGTSGASAMVAGVAASLQGMHRAAFGNSLAPNELIDLLIATGTPQTGIGQIGPLPNLRAAAEQVFADKGMPLSTTPPVISPESGSYTMPMDVVFAYGGAGQNMLNTEIWYTLDGTEPRRGHGWTIDPDQNPVFFLSQSVTIRARTYEYLPMPQRWVASEEVVIHYISTNPQVAKPTISFDQPPTYLHAPVTVTLETTTPGATIRYRTDGKSISTFFSPGTLYEGPFTLGVGEYSLVVRGYKSGYYQSPYAYAENVVVMTPQIPPPTVTPFGGTFSRPVEVEMYHDMPGVEIRYTFGGGSVMPESPLYVGPITIGQSGHLRARAFMDGFIPSSNQLVFFNMPPPPRRPVITPDGGRHHDSVVVELSHDTPADVIRYTTNGAEPTASSPVYKGGFTLGPGDHTVKARAFRNSYLYSAVAVANIRVYAPDHGKAVAPFFNLLSGDYVGPTNLSMQSHTENAIIRYAVNPDPRLPLSEWPVYDGTPLRLQPGQEYLIRAYASKPGLERSSIVEQEFTVQEAVGQVVAPTIDPGRNSYTDTVQVTLDFPPDADAEGALILFTTDGVTPTLGMSLVGVEPPHVLEVSRPTQIKAIGIRRGYTSSPVVAAEYSFRCAAPRMTTGGSFIESVTVEMQTVTPDAAIHYTLDGSEPTQRSPRYTRPIELGEGRNVVRARCFRTHFEPSRVVQQNYSVGPVPPVPVLSRHPESTQVRHGERVLLEAELEGAMEGAVDGSEPEGARYQWQRNGNNILGANEPVLEIPAASPAYAGLYRLVVETPGGQVTSREAQLTVEAMPILGLVLEHDGPTLYGEPTRLQARVVAGTDIDYQWDLGDGNRANGTQVDHTYGAAGRYTVTLTADNGVSQATATAQIEVTNESQPVVGLAVTHDGPTELGHPTHLQATIEGGTGITYSWDLGDGNLAWGRTVSHVYTQTGEFTATVTAQNAENLAVAQTLVAIIRSDQPIAGLQAANTGLVRPGETIHFQATVIQGSNVRFQWDFGDHSTGTGANPSHTYAAPGVYTAQVSASNDLGETHIATTQVMVLDNDRPIENLRASATTPTELGQETRFTALSEGSGVRYEWDFGDGHTGTGATVAHVYGAPGVYMVNLSAENDTNQASTTVEVVVEAVAEPIDAVEMVAPPEARTGQTVAFQALTGAGSDVVYSWDFGDNNTGAGVAVNHTYAEPGEYRVRVTAANEFGEVVTERVVLVKAVTLQEFEEVPEAETPEAETPDTETPDTETPDTETPDTETPDTPDIGETPEPDLPGPSAPQAEDIYLPALSR